MNVSLFVPAQATLGKNVRPWAGPGAERERHYFLGVTHAVNSSRVDPVHAKLERAMNRGDRRFVVLFAPAKFPAGPADSPGAKADWADGQVGVTEWLRFHVVQLGVACGKPSDCSVSGDRLPVTFSCLAI